MFAESLPEGCPPAEALEPNQMTVFRLLETTTPCAVDFDSHAARWPDRFGARCREFSLSVFTERSGLDRILGLPAHKDKAVARMVLTPASGRIQQTTKDPLHHSWWRYAAFDALAACEVEK